MNSLIEQLHDIEGIDSIGWWPLAIGWWILAIIVLFAVCLLTFYICYRLSFKRSWKNDTYKKLALLEKNLSEATARETLVSLSEYLRRIALRRFPRNECAGLTGDAWLKWLSKHDPKKFDWEAKGALLNNVPYSPVNAALSSSQIKELIHAVKNWVR